MAIPKLIRLSINNQHHLLGQIFTQREFAAARAEERGQLRSKDLEQGAERSFTWAFQELLGCNLLQKMFFVVDRWNVSISLLSNKFNIRNALCVIKVCNKST